MNVKVIMYDGKEITYDFMGHCIFDNVNKLICLSSVLGYDHQINIPMESTKVILISEETE